MLQVEWWADDNGNRLTSVIRGGPAGTRTVPATP